MVEHDLFDAHLFDLGSEVGQQIQVFLADGHRRLVFLGQVRKLLPRVGGRAIDEGADLDALDGCCRFEPLSHYPCVFSNQDQGPRCSIQHGPNGGSKGRTVVCCLDGEPIHRQFHAHIFHRIVSDLDRSALEFTHR